MSVPQALPTTRPRFIHVAQGDFAVSGDPGACLTTLLGSCVATCLWDPQRKMGGMNHYLLPEGAQDGVGLQRYGVNAMELLVNGMLKRGSRKSDLVAKVFGGAQMLSAETEIGMRNGQFAQRFLAAEGIPVLGGSLGGKRARRLRFFPADGRVQQRLMSEDSAAPIQTPVLEPPGGSGELELF